ncbi:MAG: hypothetical protein JO257_10000 [Deltaproteobacteria bacterium]|nr:hypothetical protein [Deltaproteobacteria bacterium]
MYRAWVCVAVVAIACGNHDHQQTYLDAPVVHQDAPRPIPDAPIPDGPVDAPPDAAPEVVMMSVGSGGGTLTTLTGATLEIPSGALTTNTTITITVQTTNLPNGIVSNVYELGPDGTQLAAPARLTLPYDPGKLGTTQPQELTIATLTQNGVTGVGWNVVEDTTHTVSGFITHFSEWAIIPNPPQGCTLNYGCFQSCTGSQAPELCCSHSRGTCRAVLHSSFPAFVACYASCAGTPNVKNFGSSACMSNCCTSHGFTVTPEGACYKASATQADAQTVLTCARGCADAADTNLMCGTGNIQLDACSWNAAISPSLGDNSCVAQGMGVNSQQLATTLTAVYDQQWGNPAVIHVTGGTISSTSISVPMTCSNGNAYSGTATGNWNGFFFATTYVFAGVNGTIQISPNW